MENRGNLIQVLTHTTTLIIGIGLGYYLRDTMIKEASTFETNTIEKPYLVDVFDSEGNHKIINYFINEDTSTIIFEKEQQNISFIITKDGKEIYNHENFSGREYKFLN